MTTKINSVRVRYHKLAAFTFLGTSLLVEVLIRINGG